MVTIVDDAVPSRESLVDLYMSVGWVAYAKDPERLETAVRNSTYVACLYDHNELVGIARGLSDDVSIFYLQDIIVRPDFQGKGHGRELLERIVERFAHVRQKVLMTDDEERQHCLYRSIGYVDVSDVDRLHAFVRLEES